MAKIIAAEFSTSVYCNWDIPRDRKCLQHNPSFSEEVSRRDASPPFVIFDEIHVIKRRD